MIDSIHRFLYRKSFLLIKLLECISTLNQRNVRGFQNVVIHEVLEVIITIMI